MSDTSLNELYHAADRAYEDGDVGAAIKALTLLAERGMAEACQYLGFIFRSEEGEFSSPEQSRFWYSKYLLLLRRRSEEGDLDATLSLGKHYQYGEILGEDPAKAYALILQAAERGHAGAQYHLANLFYYGWCGCLKDENAFLKWLDRAVDAAHPEALFKKGSYLLQIPAAEKEGLELIARSAALGFWKARELLQQRVGGS